MVTECKSLSAWLVLPCQFPLQTGKRCRYQDRIALARYGLLQFFVQTGKLGRTTIGHFG